MEVFFNNADIIVKLHHGVHTRLQSKKYEVPNEV